MFQRSRKNGDSGPFRLEALSTEDDSLKFLNEITRIVRCGALWSLEYKDETFDVVHQQEVVWLTYSKCICQTQLRSWERILKAWRSIFQTIFLICPDSVYGSVGYFHLRWGRRKTGTEIQQTEKKHADVRSAFWHCGEHTSSSPF